MDQEYFGEAKKLLSQFGLDEDFLNELFRADDWTFVVKSSALLEAALTYILVEEIGRSELEKFFTKLSMSRKIQMTNDLGMLDGMIPFIRYISDLRNTVVHGIHHSNFSINEHLTDPHNFARWKTGFPLEMDYCKHPVEWFMGAAKQFMWLLVVGVLSIVYGHVKVSQLTKTLDEEYLKRGKVLGPPFFGFSNEGE